MNLDDLNVGKTSGAEEEPRQRPVRGEKIRITDIFLRDLFCWPMAIFRYWWIVLGAMILFGGIFFIVREKMTPPVYSAVCAMIRQPIANPKDAGLPAGYQGIRQTVLYNMIRSRANLAETARRLNLKISHERLFGMVAVKHGDRNSDYFQICATAGNPKIATDVANTLAEVFLEDYSKMIQDNLDVAYQTGLRSERLLAKEIDTLEKQLHELGVYNNQVGAQYELNSLNGKIREREGQILEKKNAKTAQEKKIVDYELDLARLPEQTVSYTEVVATDDNQLKSETLKLQEMLQQYTDENPKVIKQKKLVAQMQAEAEKRKQEADAKGGVTKQVLGPNPEYSMTRRFIMNAKDDLKLLNAQLDGYQAELDRLTGKRDQLEKNMPQIRALDEQISQKKDLRKKASEINASLKTFLESGFSDIRIHELAPVPVRPTPRKRKLFLMIGIIFGVMSSCGVLLLREFFNLTTRSRVDLEKALHLPPLGIVPAFSHDFRMDFYSALQGTVSNAELTLTEGGAKPPYLVTVSPISNSDLNENLFHEICEILKVRPNFTYRIIRMARPGNTAVTPHLINDFMYRFTENLPEPTDRDELYFMLDDLAFVSPPASDRIGELVKALNCDLVIWELFEFELHRQFFTEVAECANMTVIPFLFGKTSKRDAYQMLSHLRASKVKYLAGILYNVDNKIYRRVSLS